MVVNLDNLGDKLALKSPFSVNINPFPITIWLYSVMLTPFFQNLIHSQLIKSCLPYIFFVKYLVLVQNTQFVKSWRVSKYCQYLGKLVHHFLGSLKLFLRFQGVLANLFTSPPCICLKTYPFQLLVPQQDNSQLMFVEPQPRIHCLHNVQWYRGVINQFGARLPQSYFYLPAGSRVLSGHPAFILDAPPALLPTLPPPCL